MSDVFLSYSRENQDTARLFAEALQRAGISVWWDDTLSAGEAYDEVTERALEGAKAVVVLWSKASVASRWVRAEATTADRNGTLVPVMIEACKRPIMFELRQTADLSQWKGDTHDPAWQRFVAGLLDVVSGGASPTPVAASATAAPTITRAPSRRFSPALISVIAGCLLLAGAGAFWYLNRAKPAATSNPASASEVEASIAVLPLRDMSPGQDQGYFVDGITEEILDSLARIPDLKVTARTSSFAFKDKDVNLQEVGKTLGVANILEGSLRKDGDHLKITLQLIDAKSGTHRWSKTYDRPFNDVFAIQEDIAHSVAEALQVSLGVGAVARNSGMTRSVEAYEAFVSARLVADRLAGSPQDVRVAIGQVQKAIALDPDFMAAYRLLQELYQTAPLLITDEPAQTWSGRSDAVVAEMQKRFPDSWQVHELLADRAVDQARWGDAVAEFERAAVAARKQGVLTRTYPPPAFLATIGRFGEAIAALEAMRDRDPLNQSVATRLAEAYASHGDTVAAMAEFDRGLQLEGTDVARLKGTAILTAMASRDKAEIDRRIAATGVAPAGGDANRALNALIDDPAAALVEVKRRLDDKSVAPIGRVRLAYWRAYFGDAQGALDLLQAEYRRSPSAAIIPTAMWRPVLRDVRRLPGFKQLVSDMGLVDFWRTTTWPDLCKPVGADDFECQ
jgi:TolB-like protein/tetratricopeptide (TPR) repeat protein